MVTPTFADAFFNYATNILGSNKSAVAKEIFERELQTKSLRRERISSREPSLPEHGVSFSLGQEEVERIMPPEQHDNPLRHYHLDTPAYGLVAVFENEGKTLRYGVTVYPYRHSAFLLVIDLTVKAGEFSRLDLAYGIAPDLDAVLNLSPYSWDTPEYQELCERLGLNPDHRRPKYRLAYKELADRIVAEIGKDCNADWDTLGRKNFWYDFLDLIRADQRPDTSLFERVKRDAIDFEDAPFADEIAVVLDEMEDAKLPQTPQTFAVVHFLPSAFGTGFNSSLISREGEGCEPDGWHTKLYQGLGGIALDFETNTQWLKTVRRRLVEQGVILVPRRMAEVYMQTEGTYWLWANGGFTMFHQIEVRDPTSWEEFIWRCRKPNTPLSDAAVVSFNVARMRNG